jgi:hypothetical protein
MEKYKFFSVPKQKSLPETIASFITDEDIDKYLGKGHVMKYNELVNYPTILDLLPADNSFKIILLEEKPNKGHWVALLRYGNTIEEFDSYGSSFQTELAYLGKKVLNRLHESTQIIDRLLKTIPKSFHLVINKTKFQKLQQNVNTCGRHSILRAQMMLLGYDLKEYQDFLKRLKKQYGMSYDEIVSSFVK